jgi:hypothetical protein
MGIREKGSGAHAPTHLLREKGTWIIRASTAGETQWQILDLPTAVNGTETESR